MYAAPLDPPALRVAGLRKAYPRRGQAPLVAVDGVGFKAERGEVVGLLGPNSAGKTTTMKIICGLIRPDAGDVEVCGVDARTQPRLATRHLAAVLEDNRNLYWRLTARPPVESLDRVTVRFEEVFRHLVRQGGAGGGAIAPEEAVRVG